MNRVIKFIGPLVLIYFLALCPIEQVEAQEPYQLSESRFDFGFVGIDYVIYHNYRLKNTRRKPITIDSMKTNCDCTTVRYDKTVLRPGESVDFKLAFDTRDFYGQVTRKFEVYLGLPEKKTLHFYYRAYVGQWLNGLKPDPFAIFLLPTQKEATVKIDNRFFDELKVEIENKNDTTFSLDIKKGEADKNEKMEVVVRPSENLDKGTYLSNFTLKITGDGAKEPTHLTIPVKIVRF